MRLQGIYPRGIRQISARTRLLGSIPVGIKKDLSNREISLFTNAADRNRTGTMSPPQDFKSCASASSATAAKYKWMEKDSNRFGLSLLISSIFLYI